MENKPEYSESEMKAILEFLQNQKSHSGSVGSIINASLLSILIMVVGWQTTRIINKQDILIENQKQSDIHDVKQDERIARNREDIEALLEINK